MRQTSSSDTTGYGQQMGGTHPTGMHSCVLCFQLENMVPREKLDQAYLELDHALRREQRAQQLLKEQGEQLNELGSKVDFHASAEMQKDATLTDAVQVRILTIPNHIITANQ